MKNGKYVEKGRISYYKDNLLHRDDGPAIEFLDGYKIWFSNGNKHREDGPAVEFPDGRTTWYLNGINYSEVEFQLMQKKNLNEKLNSSLPPSPIIKRGKI